MKKIIVIVIILAVILIAAVCWAWKANLWKKVGLGGNETNQESIVKPAGLPETSAFEKGNPFDVDINPVQGYKNPFGE